MHGQRSAPKNSKKPKPKPKPKKPNKPKEKILKTQIFLVYKF